MMQEPMDFEIKVQDPCRSACGIFFLTYQDDNNGGQYDTMSFFDNKHKMFPYNPKRSIIFEDDDELKVNKDDDPFCKDINSK